MDDWYTDLKRRMKEAQAPPPPPPEQEPPPEPVYREPEPRQASPQQPSLGFDMPTQRDAPPPPEPVRRPREPEPVWQGKTPKSQGGVGDLRGYIDRSQRGLKKTKEAETLPPGEERDALKAAGSVESEGRWTYLPEAFGQPYDMKADYQGKRQRHVPLPEFGEAQFPPEQYPPQPPPKPQFPERGWMKEHWQNERQAPPPVQAQQPQQPQQDVTPERERIEEDAVAPPVAPQVRRAGGRYAGLLAEAESRYELPPGLLGAVMQQESGGDPNIVSKRGAQGLLQLMPGTQRDMGVTNPFDPADNINGGARYLKQLIDRYGGDTKKALAAYNFGPGNVDAGKQWPTETQAYVPGVTGRVQQPNAPREPYSPMESGPPPSLSAPPQAEPIPGAGPAPVSTPSPQQPAPKMGVGDVVSHVLNTVAQGYLSTTGEAIKDIGITAQVINETFAKSGGDLDDYATYKAGTAIEQFAKLHFPENKDLQGKFWLGAVPRAFGAGLAFMQAGIGNAGRMIASSAIIPAITTGAGAQQAAQEAGADQTTQATAMMFGQVLGATNAIPFGSALAAIDKASGGTFKKAVLAGGVAAATGWVTQMVQSGALNQMANSLWNDNRELFTAAGFEGANANAVVSAVIGTAMGIGQTRAKIEQDPFRVEDQAPPNKKLSDQPALTAESKMPVPSVLKSKAVTSDLSGAPPTPKPSGVQGESASPETVAQTPPPPTAEAPQPVEAQPQMSTAPRGSEQEVPLRGTEPEVPLKGTPPPTDEITMDPITIHADRRMTPQEEADARGQMTGALARGPEPQFVTKAQDDALAQAGYTPEAIAAMSPAEVQQTLAESEPVVTPRDRQLASAGQPITRPGPPAGPQNQTVDQLLKPLQRQHIANVQPAPMEGNVKPDNLRDVIKRLHEGIDIPLRFGGTPKGAGGYYHPSTGGTRVSSMNDLGAVAHEVVGHAQDDKLGIIQPWANQPRQTPFDNELKPFWDGGRASQPPDGLSPLQKLAYHRAEGVAEWFRSYLINPKATEAHAPQFTAYALGMLPEKSLTTMNRYGADMRAFVNASAHDIMMANVEWEPPKSNLLNLKGDPNSFQLTAYDHWKREITDDLQPFKKAIEFAKRVGEKQVLAKDDPELLMPLLHGGHAKMDDTVNNGQVRPNTPSSSPDYRSSGPLKDVIPPGADTTEITGKMQNVITYMFAQRSVEKAGQLGHEIMRWGTDVNISSDVVNKRLAEHQALPPAERAEIEHYADKYREWADAGLQTLVAKGRMSPKVYQAIKDSNQYYVAMQRLAEISPDEPIVGQFGAGSGELGTPRTPVHKLKGSTKQIHNPYDSLLESTYRIQKESDRNEVMRDFVDLLDVPRPMHSKDKVRALAEVGEKYLGKGKPDKMDNTITVFRDGEPEYWQLHPEVFEALTRTKELEFIAPGLSTIPARIMQKLIVNSPPFQIRNFLRDMPQRAIVSTVGSHPLSSFPALKDVLGDRFLPDAWKTAGMNRAHVELGELAQSGGAQSGYFYKDRQSYHKVMERVIRETARDKRFLLLDPARMGTAVHDFMQMGETAGRLAEYRAVYADQIKNGADEMSAMVKASKETRGILDFAQVGHTIRMVNKYVPFTAAGVRGVARSGQAFSDNPKLASMQWMKYALLPVLANKAYNYMMGDNDELNQEPAYRKYMFMNWKLGKDQWLSYPMPFEHGVVAAGVAQGLDVAFGGKDVSHAYEGFPGALAKAMFPVDESVFASIPLLPGVAESINNWDHFRSRHIVPSNEEDLDLDLRKGAKSASRLSKTITDTLMKSGVAIDPRYTDHFIKRQFGYAGLYAEALSDIGRDDKPGMTGLQALGMGSADPVWASMDAQYIHKRAKGRGIRESNSGDGLQLKLINNLEDKYRESKDPEERDRIAAEHRMKAADLRARWEETAPHTNPKKSKGGSSKYTPSRDAGLVP